MIIFVRGLACGTLVLNAQPSDTGFLIKQQIQEQAYLPVCEQILLHNGRQLKDDLPCGQHGVLPCSTIHVTCRLRGGKGGFGALLRGQGRDGKLTTNFDACRDLQGRRLRHVNAEQKLKEWQSEAKERELEKIALQHIKEQQKAERKEKEALVHIDEVREAQKETVDKVKSAVEEGLASRPTRSARAADPSTSSRLKSKALSFGLEGLDDSENDATDSDSDSELTQLPASREKRKLPAESAARSLKKCRGGAHSSDSGDSGAE